MPLLLLLLCTSFICAPSAFAQLEVGATGTIGIGSTTAPSTVRQLNLAMDAAGSSSGYYYGLYALSSNGFSGSYGVHAEGRNGERAVGLRGNAEGGTVLNAGVFSTVEGVVGATNYGLHASTNAVGTTNYGLYGRSAGGATSFGVYARSDGSTNSYGLYAQGSTSAGYFVGDVTVTGTLYELSDARLKEQVVGLGERDVRAKVMQLAPKRYRMRQDVQAEGMRLNQRDEYGLIAQELEAVFPELVSEIAVPADYDPETGEELAPAATYKGVNYQGLIPLLLQVVQEQDAELTRLRQALEAAGIAVGDE
ncbi:MAG: tail fiber domain-containing protein [Bacteroidota bacterium]